MMVFALLENYLNQERGGAPTHADPSGWLQALLWCYDAVDLLKAEGVPIVRPGIAPMPETMTVNLLRFRNNPGWYEIMQELPEAIGFVTMNPVPFYAGSDENALRMLHAAIEELHTQRLLPGEIRDWACSPESSGLLERMANSATPAESRRLWVEAVHAY